MRDLDRLLPLTSAEVMDQEWERALADGLATEGFEEIVRRSWRIGYRQALIRMLEVMARVAGHEEST